MNPYSQISDLTVYGIPSTALGATTTAQQQAALDTAAGTVDEHISGRYQMPLLDWPSSVQDHTAYGAIFKLAMGPIGMAPQAGADSNITLNYYRAFGYPDRPGSGYFPGIQAQRIHPNVTPSIAVGSDPGHDAPQVSSQPRRGWQQVRGGKPVVGGF